MCSLRFVCLLPLQAIHEFLTVAVLLQIASYLEPIDILQLSRASKDLWNTLHSKASRHAWVAARQNVYPPLPDCPHFLSEPAYSYLVFERSCEVSMRYDLRGANSLFSDQTSIR